jgi:TfoX N-terminal domain
MAARGRAPDGIAADRLSAYDRLVATVPGIQRKGASIPYTSINGNMFSYLADGGTLVLRLPADHREAFLRRHATTLHTAYGIVQKEYVDVPDDLWADIDQLAADFAVSYAYAAGLRPKKTTRARN